MMCDDGMCTCGLRTCVGEVEVDGGVAGVLGGAPEAATDDGLLQWTRQHSVPPATNSP